MLTLMHDLEGHIRRGGPLRGLIRLGVPDSFALICLAQLLKEIDRNHPDLNVAVTVDNSRALSQKLEEGALDVAILGQLQNTKLFRTEFLGFQTVIWVAGASFQVPSIPLQPNDLVGQQIITNPAPSPTFSLLMDWFAESGFVPTRLSTCNSVAVIMGLVFAGAGLSILPSCIVQQQLRDKTLLALDYTPPLPKVEMFAAYPKTSISRAVPEVVRLARNILENTGFVET
jgi:DNA-binding transcriptional LysR family regulator